MFRWEVRNKRRQAALKLVFSLQQGCLMLSASSDTCSALFDGTCKEF